MGPLRCVSCFNHDTARVVSYLQWFPALWRQHFQAPTLTPELHQPLGRSAWPALQIRTAAAVCLLGRLRTFLPEQVIIGNQVNTGVISEVCMLKRTCSLQGFPDLPADLNLLQNLSELLSLENQTETNKTSFLDSLLPPSVHSPLQKQRGD